MHPHEYARLVRLAKGVKARADTALHERTMVLAAWQSAAAYYHDGLRIGKTANLLAEGLKRIKHKRLEPSAPRQSDRPVDENSISVIGV